MPRSTTMFDQKSSLLACCAIGGGICRITVPISSFWCRPRKWIVHLDGPDLEELQRNRSNDLWYSRFRRYNAAGEMARGHSVVFHSRANEMTSIKFSLPAIRHDCAGFEALINLWQQTEDCFFDDIDIDMSATSWFDADMCAAFGAILYRISDQANTVVLNNIPVVVERILSKNGFLSHYGRHRIPDNWHTTIPYQRFDAKDDRYFASYIETELMHRSEMPKMSSGLLKKFREGIFEIFSNSVIHSLTKLGIFSCGQLFPKRHKLNFSVADLGIGIRQNIKDNAGLDLDPTEAIQWATEGRNTTKRGKIPGGLGLKILVSFIDYNGGCIQIASDAGYLWRQNGKTDTAKLSRPFPGTVVSMEINTADTRSYELSTIYSEADIF